MNNYETAGALLGRILTQTSIEVEELAAAQEAIDLLQKQNLAPGLVNLAKAHLGQIHVRTSRLGPSMGNLLTHGGSSRYMGSGSCMRFPQT